MREILNSASVAPTPRHFSQAVKVGDAIYVSGQVAMDGNGFVIGKGDIREQARVAIENLRSILLEGGASLADIVKVTVYLTDITSLQAVSEVRIREFSDFPPASTAVGVSGLAHPDLLVEIDAIAILTKQ